MNTSYTTSVRFVFNRSKLLASSFPHLVHLLANNISANIAAKQAKFHHQLLCAQFLHVVPNSGPMANVLTRYCIGVMYRDAWIRSTRRSLFPMRLPTNSCKSTTLLRKRREAPQTKKKEDDKTARVRTTFAALFDAKKGNCGWCTPRAPHGP